MNNYPQASNELPRWKCHKEVWAFKIGAITLDSALAQKENRETDSSAVLLPELTNSPTPPICVHVGRAYLKKHAPAVGGYYVRYKDGYESFSPAEVFEEGYTRI